MQRLMDGLKRMLPFLDLVKDYSKESLLGETISALLNLLEDTSNFIISQFLDKAAGMSQLSLIDVVLGLNHSQYD